MKALNVLKNSIGQHIFTYSGIFLSPVPDKKGNVGNVHCLCKFYSYSTAHFITRKPNFIPIKCFFFKNYVVYIGRTYQKWGHGSIVQLSQVPMYLSEFPPAPIFPQKTGVFLSGNPDSVDVEL